MTEPNIKQELSALRLDLQQLAEHVRVKIHLAGMEAKDAWQELQPKFQSFERSASKLTHEAANELRAIGAELKSSLEKIAKDIDTP